MKKIIEEKLKNASKAVNDIVSCKVTTSTPGSILDSEQLKKTVKHLKGLGLRVVLTSGSWDLIHIGHARYFKEAKSHGDVLVVGVDSDEKVRARKGPDRPIVPEDERMEMVTHIKYVDFVIVKEHKAPKWNLIKLVQPDVLILTKETYKEKDIKDLKKHCGKVVILESQATTSTSAKIRRLQIATAKKMEEALRPRIIAALEDVLKSVR